MPFRRPMRHLDRDEMPFGSTSSGSTATAEPDAPTESRDADPWWLDPAWVSAPAALAVVGRDGGTVWNDETRGLLSRVVDGGAEAWRRWLEAAALRLGVSGAEREVLTAPRDRDTVIEVRSGPATVPGGVRQLALRELHGDDRRAADLVETISTLSHEFRTPLAAMKSSLNLVYGEEAGPLAEPQRRFLGMTLRNIDRLDRLVRDLLDVARADAGKLPLHLREVDLGPILAEAVAQHRTGAEEEGLQLTARNLPERLAVYTDPDKILQMLGNVVGNAIKYCRPGDEIEVELESGPLAVGTSAGGLARRYGLEAAVFEFIVRDTGPGIDPRRLEAAFEPFSRAHEESSGRPFGAGLGLYITRGLVEAHSGRISLDSVTGRGTTVRILLPADPQAVRLLRAERTLGAWKQNAASAGANAGRTAAILDFRAVTGPAPHRIAVVEQYLAGAGDEAAPRIEIAPGLWAAWLPRERAGADCWREYLVERGESERWLSTRWEPADAN